MVESYPAAAWKSLKIHPPPDQLSCRVSHLAKAYAALTSAVPLTTSHPPNYAQLQAIVAGIAGIALERRIADQRHAASYTLTAPSGWLPSAIPDAVPVSSTHNSEILLRSRS